MGFSKYFLYKIRIYILLFLHLFLIKILYYLFKIEVTKEKDELFRVSLNYIIYLLTSFLTIGCMVVFEMNQGTNVVNLTLFLFYNFIDFTFGLLFTSIKNITHNFIHIIITIPYFKYVFEDVLGDNWIELEEWFLFNFYCKQLLICCQIFIKDWVNYSSLLNIGWIFLLKFSVFFHLIFLWLKCFLKEFRDLSSFLLFLWFWLFQFSLSHSFYTWETEPFNTVLKLWLFVLSSYTFFVVFKVTPYTDNSWSGLCSQFA